MKKHNPRSDLKALIRRIALVGVIASFCIGSAWAEDSQDWKMCAGKLSTPNDQRLAACTTIIDAGNEPPPNLALAYCNRAIADDQKGDLDRAMADLDEAVRLDTEEYTSLTCRGYQYHYRRDFDRAIADYDKAISSNAGRPEAFTARGNAYRAKGDLDHAIADYSAAIQRSPTDALALYARGSAYLVRKDLDLAIADLSDAIKLDPGMSAAYADRGRAFWSKGDVARANSDFDDVRRLRKLAP